MKEKGVIQGFYYNEMKEQQSVIKTLEDAKRNAKKTKTKNKTKENNKGDRSYSERVRAK